MSHQPLEHARLVANVDEGSETDVESGHANNHDESASFLEDFKGDHAAHDEQQIAKKGVRKDRSRILAILYNLTPWALSLVLLIALLSKDFQSQYLCDGGVKAQYTLAEDRIEYRTELMYDGVDNRNPMSEYQGWPNDEKDKLWDQFDGRRPDTFGEPKFHD